MNVHRKCKLKITHVPFEKDLRIKKRALDIIFKRTRKMHANLTVIPREIIRANNGLLITYPELELLNSPFLGLNRVIYFSFYQQKVIIAT